MTKTMLIDAAHPEETRVVVTDNNQIDEFDFESSTKSALRGNIYLAKVTRVEPSLQAAFVDYGGNRHGFLAFNEIHPDYYQIPVGDREELLREHAAEERENAADEDADSDEATETPSEDDEGEAVADIGGDAHEEASTPISSRALHRKYKIQEVIKRRQIILVQVLKEERGNKGAALTTYMSLAGRYCVLMPNTARGGGISRKINNSTDRKKLKKIIEKLDVPDGMGLIVRTAGAQRTLAEIRRDWLYLSQMWEEVRENTVSSQAPALVYEEGSLVRRCIRDVYSKDFDEVCVSGPEAYKEARNYMKLLMPSHARKVKQHTEATPLFKQHGVEDKLTAMFNPIVALPSGGYLVINQTEALVAIDVNSGKSTREYSVEKTALATNLEAATEVARQARLRDLAGLLVIDFIDMDENRNNRAVERRMKEALKNDRARIQVGRISSFGLMEMSRQRMRAGVLEGSSNTCVHCNGSGMVRSVESRALHVLREIDERSGKYDSGEINAQVPEDVATYLLNQKRKQLSEIEDRTGVTIVVIADPALTAMEMALTMPDQTQSEGTSRMEGDPKAALDGDSNKPRRRRRRGGRGRRRDGDETDENGAELSEDNANGEISEAPEASGEDNNDAVSADDTDAETGDEKPKRRRRGRRGGRGRRRDNASNGETEGTTAEADAQPLIDSDLPVEKIKIIVPSEDAAADEAAADDVADAAIDEAAETPVEDVVEAAEVAEADDATEEVAEKPKRKPRKKAEPKVKAEPKTKAKPKAKKAASKSTKAKAEDEAEAPAEAPVEEVAEAQAEAPTESPAGAEAVAQSDDVADDDAPKKRGWWKR